MKDISNITKTAQMMVNFRRRDKYGKFLPGLKKTNKGRRRSRTVIKKELCEDGCVNLVAAMMMNICKNIETPNRIIPVAYNRNIINYLNSIMSWIEIDTLWIPNWCELYDFDEEKTKAALKNKIRKKLKDYED